MAIIRVDEKLWFGAGGDCRSREAYATVHACKSPCHQKGVGYKGSLTDEHPNYLSLEKENNLYLNMIDPPAPLFRKKIFEIFIDFVDRKIKDGPVLIHCNQGLSRAPSLALLYMAKRLSLLPGESFAAARAAFEKEFPYTPGKGIEIFLNDNWAELG